jgi:hypothetical protein
MFLCHGNRILVAAKNVKYRYVTVLGIMFLGLPDPDPDPLVRGMDPDLAPDPAPALDPSLFP